MDQKYKDIVDKDDQLKNREKVLDPEAEKAKKKARKTQFFEAMGEQIDKIALQRYYDENKNFLVAFKDKIQERKLVNKKLTVSQRILFNKDNPFEGSDGFAHLLYK